MPVRIHEDLLPMLQSLDENRIAESMNTGKSDSTETERPTGSRSSQEDSCGHAEMEFKMSVTVSREWTDAMKSHDAYYDCEGVLNQIVSKATNSKRHNVEIKFLKGSWTLEGCFCCIQKIREALRKALEDEIRKKKTRKNYDRLVSGESSQDLRSDQKSHRENVEKNKTDLNDITPETSLDKPTCGNLEMEKSNIGSFSDNGSRNEVHLECQKEDKATLKSGDEDSSSENLNKPEERKKRERNLIVRSHEVNINQPEDKGVNSSGDTEGIHRLKKEERPPIPKNETHYQNMNQSQLCPNLSSPSKKSEKYDSMKSGEGANAFQYESSGDVSRVDSKGRDDLSRNRTPIYHKHSENQNHQVKHEDLGLHVATSNNNMPADYQKHQVKSPHMQPQKNTEHRDTSDMNNIAAAINASDSQEGKTNDTEDDRICALMLLPSIYADEDIFNYLARCRSHEFSRIRQKCNLLEMYNIGKGQKLAFDVQSQFDTASVIAEFRALSGKMTVSVANVDIPDGVDPASLKSLAESMNEFKDVGLRVIHVDRKRVLRIVGPYKEMDRARKTLIDIIASQRQAGHGFDATANKKAHLNDQLTNAPMQNAPTQTAPMHNAPMNKAPMHSAPMQNAPIHSAPMQNVPIHNVAMHNAPMHDVPMQNAPMDNAPTHNAHMHNVAMHNAPTHNAHMHNVAMYNAPMNNAPAGTAQSHSYAASVMINLNQSITSVFTFLSKTNDSLLLSALNSVTIEVKRDDLTSIQDVDVVVSYITHQLDVASPLAKKIIGAAGSNVKMELATLKKQLSFLHTGCLVHTSAGNLTRVKRIIHVVPPELCEFPYGDVRSRDALRRVFINCFRRTNDDLMMKSICLPPIGFTSYGAEMVVDCFLDAVKIFAETAANPSSAPQHPHHLSLIQLVAIDHHCIDKLLKCIKRRLHV